MKKQYRLFLTAIMFYTRIPVTNSLVYSDELLNRATRYFPFIGWIVGGISAAVFYGLSWLFPHELAVLFSMVATILLTGAFHEDGFADFCDGFGGGYTSEKILEIMKDSRIGTYGAIGLVGMLATKFIALYSLPVIIIPFVLLAGHAFSRLMPVLVIFTSQYSRTDALSKSKPVGKRGKVSDLIIAGIFALLPLLLFQWLFVIIVIPLALLATFLFKSYTEKRIGGYTGDCLGALQQISEVLFYLCLLVVS